MSKSHWQVLSIKEKGPNDKDPKINQAPIHLVLETRKQLSYFTNGSFHHSKAFSQLDVNYLYYFSKNCFEACNKLRELAKEIKAGLGISGYGEKIGEKGI